MNCLLAGRHRRHRRHGVRVCVMDAELHKLLLVEIHNPRVEIICKKVCWLAEELAGLMLCVGVLHIGQQVQVNVNITKVLHILPSCEKGVLSNKLALISGIIIGYKHGFIELYPGGAEAKFSCKITIC